MTKIVDDLWECSLAKLEEGNRKYLSAKTSEGDISLELRRQTFQNGQRPYAVVVSCSDSRVIPESIFSAGIGDLFVIRVVGNVVDKTVLASVDYAVSHLGVPLVLVLGHTGCGAVNAAIAENASGLIESTIQQIKAVIGSEKDDYKASLKNVEAGVAEINKAICAKNPNAKAIGAMYIADTGKVQFFN